jgi:hypothetical protein
VFAVVPAKIFYLFLESFLNKKAENCTKKFATIAVYEVEV